jgi:hypothetical protein
MRQARAGVAWVLQGMTSAHSTPSSDPDPSTTGDDHRAGQDDDGSDSIVEDAIDFFTAEGDEDSPASDSDAPAPG